MVNSVGRKPFAVSRILKKEALHLFRNASLLELGGKADALRRGLHPGKIVSFVIDRNINYTNICVSGCKFCAFSRPPQQTEPIQIRQQRR